MNIKDIENRKWVIIANILLYLTIIIYFGYNIPLCIEYFKNRPGILVEFLVSFPLIFIFSVIIHEAGHLLCGLISHFRFLSFEVLGLKIVKKNNKIKLARGNFIALGQCLLGLDKENRSNANIILYLSGGFIANSISSLIGLILAVISVLLKGYIAPYASGLLLINLFFVINNAIPLSINGLYNDALNIKLSRISEDVKRTIINSIVLNTYIEEKEDLSEFDEDIINNDFIVLPYWYTYDYPFKELRLWKHILDKEYREALDINNPLFLNRYYYPKPYFRNIIASEMFLKIINNETYEFLFKSKEGERLIKGSFNSMTSVAEYLYKYNKGEYSEYTAKRMILDLKKLIETVYKKDPIQRQLQLSTLKVGIEYIDQKEFMKTQVLNIENTTEEAQNGPQD